jgi:hypothetical protein
VEVVIAVNMISQDSVLTTSNYFVTVDKINSAQMVKGVSGSETLLQKISDAESVGFYVETRYFDIYVSPFQKFIVNMKGKTGMMKADDLEEGMEVLTYFGWEPIKLIHFFSAPKEMSNILTKSKFFLANGFYLVSD